MDAYRALADEHRDMAERLELFENHAGIGLWDALLHEADPFHEKSHWRWSNEFRRLMGYRDKSDFPDKVESWSDKLHPDDYQPTADAFLAHLHDYSGRTPYDVTYRLKLKSGDYRWFRATGKAQRDDTGKPLRVSGSLIDIHEAQSAQERIASYAETCETTLSATANEIAQSAGTIDSRARETASQADGMAEKAIFVPVLPEAAFCALRKDKNPRQN